MVQKMLPGVRRVAANMYRTYEFGISTVKPPRLKLAIVERIEQNHKETLLHAAHIKYGVCTLGMVDLS